MVGKSFNPNGLATAIGSMPHTDPQEACSVVLSCLAEIPVWPQLPHRAFTENMYAQYAQGFPGLMMEKDRVYVNRSADLSPQLEALYEAYLGNDIEKYALTPEYAAGFHRFCSQSFGPITAVKGQVTGPISFGLMVTDQDRRSILYDETLADALAKHLRLKAAWQERQLSKISPNTIMFIDEPYLSSLGSAFMAISPEMVTTLVDEVLGGIAGLTGIHCCGNTDWPVLLNTSIDILNFDAYDYGGALGLYPAELKSFLGRGGVLAWGIVPTNIEMLQNVDVSKLVALLEELIDSFVQKGISRDILLQQCLITPACGLASLSPEMSENVLRLTADVSREFRRSNNR